ncbi:MAG TPA: hypothetical protein VMN36_12200 [Verrucomicrobiales bacterium]|nr:hypothetical protein [Verrucomicrobiales bacterium]
MSVLQRIRRDLSLPVWAFVALSLAHALSTAYGQAKSPVPGDAVYLLGSWFIACWWLWHDARVHRYSLPMSFGLLFLLAAPIVAPAYIFKTRRWWGLVTIALYGGIFVAFAVLRDALYRYAYG